VPEIDIIINADDLGMSAHVNETVFELMADRRISSATLIANGPALHQAATQLKQFPHCSFGAHLNLTQFEPVTGGQGARLLVNRAGQLTRAIETRFPTIGVLRAAYEEWCAQIDRLVSMGVSISHLNSHHHVHTRPHLFPVLKAVQRRYGIRKVRLAKNLYSAREPCTPGLYRKKRMYNWALRHVYRTHTTDAFTELLTFVDVARDRSIRSRSVELMVHPGASNAAEETALLESDWAANLHLPMKLISFTDLTS
jgi:chitin disaccharide deacetylase